MAEAQEWRESSSLLSIQDPKNITLFVSPLLHPLSLLRQQCNDASFYSALIVIKLSGWPNERRVVRAHSEHELTEQELDEHGETTAISRLLVMLSK